MCWHKDSNAGTLTAVRHTHSLSTVSVVCCKFHEVCLLLRQQFLRSASSGQDWCVCYQIRLQLREGDRPAWSQHSALGGTAAVRQALQRCIVHALIPGVWVELRLCSAASVLILGCASSSQLETAVWLNHTPPFASFEAAGS